MHIDKRGRIRFTHNSVRYEINHLGELRSYRRGAASPNSERRTRTTYPSDGVDVNALGLEGSVKMLRALRTHRARKVT